MKKNRDAKTANKETRNWDVTDISTTDGNHVLRRIRAARKIILVGGKEIAKGTLGGWVENPANVSPLAWVGDDACVIGNAKVLDAATVTENAHVSGEAVVMGHAEISGTARVRGNAVVADFARVGGDARVGDHATVRDYAVVSCDAWVRENATVRGCSTVVGTAEICGASVIHANNKVKVGKVEDVALLEWDYGI